jgi:Bacterial SH3 domain
MSFRNASGPLVVEVPPSSADRPSWAKVGVITAMGFIVGVAWPRIAGVRLGPSVPEASSTMVPAASSGSLEIPAARTATSAATLALASAPATSPPVPPPAAPTSQPRANITVGRGTVVGCTSVDGGALKGNECGAVVALDSAITPRLRRLAECPDAASTEGKLRLVLHVDFGRGAVDAEQGRGTTGISHPEPLVACARVQLAGIGLGGIPHDNPRYTVAYVVSFAPERPGSSDTIAPPADPADATAQVQWDVAIVRDAPKTGKVIARLQRGTALHVGSAKDGWYPVKYGDGFASDGWVYRAAIGR